MINTVFVSSVQIAHLTRLAGWQPFPWSPVMNHLGAPEPTPTDLEALADKGLVIDQGGSRVNAAISVALAAVCEPDQQIEIALPNAEPVYLCRAGAMTVGWHGYDDGGIALSFPLTFADRHRLLTDLLVGDEQPTGNATLRLQASATEVEILMAVGEHAAAGSAITADDLIRELLSTDRPVSESLTGSIMRLTDDHLLDGGPGPLGLAGAASMFQRPLAYGFLVKRLRMPDPTAPCVIDALHVYRSADNLVVTRQLADDSIECQQVSRRQLADMILTLTLDADALAEIHAD